MKRQDNQASDTDALRFVRDNLHAGELRLRWCRAFPDIRPARNMSVMTVALDRLAASFSDSVFERGDRLLLRSGGAGHVENFFL